MLGRLRFAEATRGVATNLVGGGLRIPQRDEAQRQHATTGLAAPLVVHPVVVGVHAEHGELLVLGLVEGLATETGERGEAERGLDARDVHVLESFFQLVAALTHLVVGDAGDGDFVAFETDGGVEARERTTQVLVEPPVGQRALVTLLAGDGGELAADERHLLDGEALDARAHVVVLLREAVGPDRGRLGHVVVDGNDLGQFTHAGEGSTRI
jgi:hypothetical protein